MGDAKRGRRGVTGPRRQRPPKTSETDRHYKNEIDEVGGGGGFKAYVNREPTRVCMSAQVGMDQNVSKPTCVFELVDWIKLLLYMYLA